jgi:MtN3 and saliva related transmembrane protein
MLIAFTTGVGLWDVYGILLRAWPIIITNSVTFVLALVLVAMKRRFASPVVSPHSQPSDAQRSASTL